jgi:hypothetical protein
MTPPRWVDSNGHPLPVRPCLRCGTPEARNTFSRTLQATQRDVKMGRDGKSVAAIERTSTLVHDPGGPARLPALAERRRR